MTKKLGGGGNGKKKRTVKEKALSHKLETKQWSRRDCGEPGADGTEQREQPPLEGVSRDR